MALRPDGRGLVVVGDDAQSIYSFRAATVRNILDFPKAFSPPAAVVTLSAQLPLDAGDPRRLQCGDRPGRGALRQGAVVGARLRRQSRRWWSPPTRPTRRAMWSSGCSPTAKAGMALKQQAVLFRAAHHSRPARNRADPAQHPLRQIWRAQVPRCRACQGRAGAAALRREPARPRVGLPRAAASAGHRPVDARRTCSTGWRRPSDAARRLPPISRRRGRRPTGRASPRLPRTCAAAGPAGRRRWSACGCGTSRIWSASTRMPSSAATTSSSSNRSPPAIRAANAS